jgi:plastocyanin
MKLFTTLGILTLAGVAAAFSGADETPAQDCCSSTEKPSTEIKNNYLMPDPVPAGEVDGKIGGRIVFEGEAPKSEPLKIGEDQSKGCTSDGAKVDAQNRSLLIGKDGGIANCVVTVEVKGKELRVPEKAIVLDQTQCRFEPHVTILPAGATVEYMNSDTVSHNVHTFAVKNKSFNNTIPAGASQEQTLDKAEAVQLKCDIHPWMMAYMFVSDTNYACLTDADGGFSISGLPAGDYDIKVWHETLGKGKGKVTVKEDGTSERVEIKMAAEKKGGGRRRR